LSSRSPLFFSTRTSSDRLLDGLDDRKRTVDAGASALWRTRVFTVGASVYSDVRGNSDGASATVRLSMPIQISLRWRITPNIGAEW
jgi:outer membrane scaffolding protein for murein synthesis (MipA/OmpV family)